MTSKYYSLLLLGAGFIDFFFRRYSIEGLFSTNTLLHGVASAL